MKNQFKPCIALLALMIMNGVFPVIGQSYFFDGSRAAPDAVLDPWLNPAALATREGISLGFSTMVPAGQDFSLNPYRFETYSLLSLNAGGTGIVYEDYKDSKFLTVGNGFTLLPGISLGTAYRSPVGRWAEAQVNLGLLLRPHSSLSLALVGEVDMEDQWAVYPSLGFRPLALGTSFGDRITLTVDGAYTSEVGLGDYFGLRRLGAEIKIFPGFGLRGSWYNNSTWTVGFEFAAGYTRTTSNIHITPESELKTISFTTAFETPAHRGFGKPDGSKIIEYTGFLNIAETTGFQDFGFLLFSDGRRDIRSFIEEIQAHAENPEVAAILFYNPVFNGDLAQLIEVAQALNTFREEGKEVLFYFESPTTLTYLLAALSADEVHLHPAGSLFIQGIGSSQLYFRDVLERFGIDPVGFETHPAKSANHTLTDSGLTDEARENLETYLGDLYSRILSLIEEGRSEKLTDTAREIWENAPYLLAQKALDTGLVDSLSYRDTFYETIKDRYPRGNLTAPNRTPYQEAAWFVPELPKIALIYAVGTILPGDGKPGSSIGSESLSEQIRRAREDDAIQGIVLRINSGGGSALASDAIAREVYLTTRGENPKPLVVSMGSVAASGGYYIAAYADRIIAYPTTLTGSIGVTSLTFQINRLLEEWNIGVDGYAPSSSSLFLDPFRTLREEDTLKMNEYSLGIYQQFLRVVSEGRNMPIETVDEVAQGQVWTGSQALDRGLVDELGDFQRAIDLVKELSDIHGEVEIVSPSAFDQFQIVTPPSFAFLQKDSHFPELDALLREMRVFEQLSNSGALLLLPYRVWY